MRKPIGWIERLEDLWKRTLQLSFLLKPVDVRNSLCEEAA